MNLNLDCVVVVPTHNRQDYIVRSMAYFSSFNMKVVYLDSSKSVFRCKTPSNVKYVHCPSLTFVEKISKYLGECTYPYVCLCADDDIIFEESVNVGLDYLSKNKNVSTVVGNHLGFKKESGGSAFLLKKTLTTPKLTELANSNVNEYLSNYHQVLWGLYRKDMLKGAFEILEETKFENDNFIEILLATYASYHGGIKVMDVFFGAREVTESISWGKKQKSIRQIEGEYCFIRDKVKFIASLRAVMGEEIPVMALDSYLHSGDRNKGNKSKMIYKYLEKKILSFMYRRDIQNHSKTISEYIGKD